jgi:hypothetical protein
MPDNIVICISLGLVSTRERKELAIQKTTGNLVLLEFVLPELVLPGDEGGDDPKDDRKP